MLEAHQKDRIVKLLVFLIGVFIVFMAVKTINEIKTFSYIGQREVPQNTITVEGEGEIFAIPDTATFRYSVSAESNTVALAQESVTETQNEIIAYLEGEGVDRDNIKTVGYSAFPRYGEARSAPCTPEFCPPSPPSRGEIVGYEVRHEIEVKVEDTEVAGELLSGVSERGATNIGGIFFEVEDETELVEEAREQAIEEAQDKAEKLANQLGVDLGRLVSFSDSGHPYYYGERAAMEQSFGSDDAVAVPDIPTGENRFVSNVILVYEIR